MRGRHSDQANSETALHKLPTTPSFESLMTTYDQLFPSPLNPRRKFEKIDELALSIFNQTVFAPDGKVLQSGLVMPIIARQVGRQFEIAAGERRFRAIQRLVTGFSFEIQVSEQSEPISKQWIQVPPCFPIPIIVKNLSDSEMIDLAVAENTNRQDLSLLERIDVLLQWKAAGLTERTMAFKFGVCINTIRTYIALGRHLCIKARSLLERGEINISQAKILASVKPPLYHTLLKAAEEGMNATHMRATVNIAAFTVEHAIFDIQSSGLKIEKRFVDSYLSPKFADQQAAIAAQIEELQCRAQAICQQNPNTWCDVVGIDSDPEILPPAYQQKGITTSGTVLAYHTLTGRVKQFEQVYRVKTEQEAQAELDELNDLPEVIEPKPQSRAERDLRKAELEAQHHANIDELMVAPQIALAHVIATLFDQAKVDRSAPVNQEFAQMLAECHPNLFQLTNPGSLKRKATKADLFTTLRGWSIPALAELLVYLTSAQVKDKVYADAVALTLEQHRAANHN